MSDDVDLLARWRAGDRAAGNALVQRHHGSVFRFFGAKLEDSADDLTQQTLLALVERNDDLAHVRSFKAYLFGIARHVLVTRLRRAYRSDRVFAPDTVSIDAIRADSNVEPSRAFARNHRQRLLLTALRTLPLEQQITLELHYWEDLSVAEIAEALDSSPGTIKSRLARARTQLQSKIDKLASQRRLVRLAGEPVDELVSSLGDALRIPKLHGS